MLDIDFYKPFNDTFGHQEGGHCLKIIAKAISKNLTQPSDIAARYGGEKITVILPSTDITCGELIAQQIVTGIARIKTLKPNPHTGKQLILSIEVAYSCENNRLHANEIIEAAGTALYKAKEQDVTELQ